MRWWTVILVAASACYHPSPPEGAACANATDCPDPLHCFGGLCLSAAPNDASTFDAFNPTCACSNTSSLTCASGSTTCDFGCATTAPGPHCLRVVPSNGVDPTLAEALGDSITIAGNVTFNTDTGLITGSLMRAGGEGIDAGIDFEKRASGTASLGVFSFHALEIAAPAAVLFVGTRSAVFMVAGDFSLDGTIDGSSDCADDPTCPGPGGGIGGATGAPATGCAGGAAITIGNADTGGGGGGGGSVGGAGGKVDGTATTNPPGGVACIEGALVPLVGGGGGGVGGPGSNPVGARGGGGGGALQITSLTQITINGILTMAGGGGEGANPGTVGNAGGGAGGGGGGGILLEAPMVSVTAFGLVAANGGGGGGAASSNSPFGMTGARGGADTDPASGGQGGGLGGSGGNGGTGTVDAEAGANSTANGGGGGGGVGAIFVRSLLSPVLDGSLSPSPGTGQLVTR